MPLEEAVYQTSFPRRTDREAPDAAPAGGKDSALEVASDHDDVAPIVPPHRVLEKKDAAVLGDARMRDPPRRLSEDCSRRQLQALLSPRFAHDREARAVRRPGGPEHVLHQLARRSPSERGPGQDAVEAAGRVAFLVRPLQDDHLPLRRDVEDFGVSHVHGARFGGAGAGREDPRGLAVPRSAVEHRLSVGGEAGRANQAAPVGEPLKLRRIGRRVEDGAPPRRETVGEERPDCRTRENRRAKNGERNSGFGARKRRDGDGLRRGRRGERLELI